MPCGSAAQMLWHSIAYLGLLPPIFASLRPIVRHLEKSWVIDRLIESTFVFSASDLQRHGQLLGDSRRLQGRPDGRGGGGGGGDQAGRGGGR